MSHDLQNAILKNIQDAHGLEELYRKDKSAFKKAFNMIYPEISSVAVAQYWNERLNHVSAPSIFLLSLRYLLQVVLPNCPIGCIGIRIIFSPETSASLYLKCCFSFLHGKKN
jgi:hypothetical protein